MLNTLRQGSRGPEVVRIQRALNKAGRSTLAALKEDGDFGRKTLARVQEFQRNNRLVVDGVVGPKTLAALHPFLGPAGPAVGPPGAGGAVAAAVVAAAKQAHLLWKTQARFQNVRITAAIATAPPGCLIGPDLAPLIMSQPQLVVLQGDARALAQAAAGGIGANFGAWQKGVMVPGLPWYPMFAMVPAPMAPPTPNVPLPLVACASGAAMGITAIAPLQAAMEQHLEPKVRAADPQGSYRTTFSAVAGQLAPYFASWLNTQLVANVMGQGPVPSFAPPASPGGPVVNGFTVPGAGHLP